MDMAIRHNISNSRVGLSRMYNVLQVGLQWWDTWQAQSVNRRIFSALMTVGALTALAEIASAYPHSGVSTESGVARFDF